MTRRVLNYIDILVVAYCILYGLFDYLDFRVLIMRLGAIDAGIALAVVLHDRVGEYCVPFPRA